MKLQRPEMVDYTVHKTPLVHMLKNGVVYKDLMSILVVVVALAMLEVLGEERKGVSKTFGMTLQI